MRRNWYDAVHERLWRRRHSSIIAIIRTTVMEEAHWEVLKRYKLMQYSHLRLDLLVHMIEIYMKRKYCSTTKPGQMDQRNRCGLSFP